MSSFRLSAVAIVALLLLGPTGAAAQQSAGRVIGAVLKDGDPVSRVPVRLRDVASGRVLSRTTASERGEFSFATVPPGSYVPELLGEDDRVLFYGEVFSVLPGQTVVTEIDTSRKRQPPRRSSDSDAGTSRTSGRLGRTFWTSAAAVASGAVLLGMMSSER